LGLILIPFGLVTGLLTVLLLVEVFADVLTRALGGTLPGLAVAVLITLQVPALLIELMPGAFFLAAVLALADPGHQAACSADLWCWLLSSGRHWAFTQ
jgi:lipopolysaccharide export LptBFGC system permease protein LptF